MLKVPESAATTRVPDGASAGAGASASAINFTLLVESVDPACVSPAENAAGPL
jgi:hypothetical protein